MVQITGDVIERRKLEQQLKEHAKELERRVEERTRDLERRVRALQGLYEVSDLFRDELEQERISGEVTERIAGLMDVEQCCVILYDKEAMVFNALFPACGMSKQKLEALSFSLMDAANLFGHWVGKDPLVSNDPPRDERLMGELAGKFKERNLLLAKLLVGGEFLGLLMLANKRRGAFSSDDAGLAHILASRFGAALHNMMLFKELRESEAQLRRYAQELERSNKLKDLFTDIMRHDLLNPVTVIKGVSQILERSSPEEVKVGLAKIGSNASKLEVMIESAARLSKLDDEGGLCFKEEDLSAMFKEMVDNFRPMFAEKGIKVVYLPKGKCVAMVSSVVEDVFANLLSNAVKYSPPKSMVTIDILDDGNAWKVMVADQGEGVPEECKEAIFNRFERGGKEGVKGTGLGLAIVKRVVELHKGKVWVEDNTPRGSIFYVLIPKNR